MSASTSTQKIDALAQEPVLAGQLAHAMLTAQRVIYNTNKMCHQQQITGLLRRMPIRGIDNIQIIVRPKLKKNLAADILYDFQATELAEYLRKRFNAKTTRSNEYIYRFNLETYDFHIIMVYEPWEMPVAQLQYTGPPEFFQWLSTETEVDNGAMPWGFYFKHFTLFNNSKKRIKNIKKENDIFKAIGYNYISTTHRFQGNPETWSKYQLSTT